jgi:hypothetical protein
LDNADDVRVVDVIWSLIQPSVVDEVVVSFGEKQLRPLVIFCPAECISLIK